MKILKIRIKNLNSLLMDKEIDFMQSPFLETGLFAIVGDTGAGKTTILDAITLGLYGKVHRNKDVKEVLSYGATECMAEVEFEVKNERYLGHWDIYRARNKVDGKIQSPTRQIRKWDEANQDFLVLTDRIREVDEEIEKITGLDYDRFCRSVLLSQGDFAAFLKSNEKDRSDLLERITGTEIYSEISKAAHAKLKTEEVLLRDEQQKLANLSLLDKEEVKELKQLLKEKKEAGKELKNELESLRKTQQWYLGIQNLQQRQMDLETKKAVIVTEKIEQEADLIRLQLHLKTLPFQTELARLDDKNLEINALKIKIAELNEKIATFEKEELQVKTVLKKEQAALTNFKKNRPELLKLFDKVLKLDVEIASKELPLKNKLTEVEELKIEVGSGKEALINLQQRLKQEQMALAEEKKWLTENSAFKNLPNEYEKIYDWLKDTGKEVRQKDGLETELRQKEAELKLAQETEETFQKELATIKLKIEKTEGIFKEELPADYAFGRSELLVNLSQEIEKLKDKKKNLAEFQKMNLEYGEMLQELGKYHEQLESLQNEEFQVNKKMLDSFQTVDDARDYMEFKQNVFEQQKLILNYENARTNLAKNQPCPLCYSKEHPFRNSDFTPFINEAQNEFTTAKKRYEKVKIDLRKLEQKQRDLHLQIQELKGNEVEELGGRMQQRLQKIKAFEGRIADTIAIYQEEEFRAVDPAVFTEKIEKFSGEIAAKRELQETLHQLNHLLEKLQKEEKILSGKWQKQQLLVQQKTGEIIYNQKNISTLEKNIVANLARLTKQLKPFGIDFNLAKGNEIFGVLKKKKIRIEENSEKLQTLNRQVSVFEKEGDLTAKSLAENEKRLEKLKKSLIAEKESLQDLKTERQALFGIKNVEGERQQFQENLDAKEQLVDAAKKSLNEVILQLKTNRHQQAETKTTLKKGEEISAGIHAKILSNLEAAGFANLEELRLATLKPTEAKKIQAQGEIIQQKESENQQFLKAVTEDLAKELTKGDPDLDMKELQKNLETKEENFQNLQQAIGGIDQKIKTNEQRKKDAKILLQTIDNQRKEVNRWKALYDLIGSPDGRKFRIFAQGLTLKKLVQLANAHLQNLHGRYLILKPDDQDLRLDIVDTYQADNVRSMNTLSGGESFLVSLALALGLSDLAGRNTNIRSLFIDEGFGTLDESTLDLAISTLENLQSSGKTIGIISHVKELKERITTQIQVRKKGSGFSELTIEG